MPKVEISEATFAKAKAAAEPLVDNADSVISRALDLLLKEKGGASSSPPGESSSMVRLAVGTRELTHTRLLSATVDGTDLPRPDWNSLARDLHVLALQRLGTFEAVRRASSANLRPGRFEDHGFRYLREADFSVQGCDANRSCECAFRLAQAMNVALRVTFEWLDKEESVRPGKVGLIEWSPGQTRRWATTAEERQAAMDRWKLHRPRLDEAGLRELIKEARR